MQQIIGKALKSTAQPAAAAKLKGKEVEIRRLMLEREKGAENFKPRGRLLSKLEVLEYFTAAHQKLMQQLAGAKDIDNYIYKHPNKDYGEMTARQWFYYVAYHKMRHTRQIEAIKAHKDFPGRVRTAELRLELATVRHVAAAVRCCWNLARRPVECASSSRGRRERPGLPCVVAGARAHDNPGPVHFDHDVAPRAVEVLVLGIVSHAVDAAQFLFEFREDRIEVANRRRGE